MDDELYNEMLAEQIGDIQEITDIIRTAPFTGPEGFQLHIKSFKLVSDNLYSFHLKGISRDELFLSLTLMKDFFPEPNDPSYPKIKKGTIFKESVALGVDHMTGYVITRKNGTFEIHIPYVNFELASSLSRCLFEW